MNKVITVALIAGGLMLLNSPEAAAHKEARNVYQPSVHYQVEVRRSGHMPRWLKRNHAFRHWYAGTPLKRDRRLAWDHLFDIYRWEMRRSRVYFRADNHWNDYYAYRYNDRHHRRDKRHKGRRSH